MKLLTILLTVITLVFIQQKKAPETKVVNVVKTSAKNKKIINTYKHPYYKRYVNYDNNLNSGYINYQNSQNQEGC